MKVYRQETVNLFGEPCLDLYNKDMELLVSLGDAHANEMEKLKLDPYNDQDVVNFLKHQYPDLFPNRARVNFIPLS